MFDFILGLILSGFVLLFAAGVTAPLWYRGPE